VRAKQSPLIEHLFNDLSDVTSRYGFIQINANILIFPVLPQVNLAQHLTGPFPAIAFHLIRLIPVTIGYNIAMIENWGMLGHQWAVDLLQAHMAAGASRHAYLFAGPDGVGRRTLALAFAKAINCTHPPKTGEFCGECRTCRQTDQMQHPDLSIIARIDGSRDIKVEAVRQLQRSLSLAPYEAPSRIALLVDFENASVSAANALLKTLEEPSPRVKLLLTAESGAALLPTIVSRCEVLRLRPVPLETVSRGLQQRWGVDAAQASLLAHISGGRPGYALYLHQNPGELEQRSIWLDEHQHLLGASRRQRFDYAQNLGKDRPQLDAALQVWLSFWRDVLLRSAQASAPLANPDHDTQIDGIAANIDLQTARRVVAAIERTQTLLGTNVNTRLAAEVLLLNMPYL